MKNEELGGRGIVRRKRSCKGKEFRMKMKGHCLGGDEL